MANLSNSIHNVQGKGSDKGGYTYYPVLIVGAGESGIAAGCRLKAKLGFDQFRIFDRQAGIGGTWWINKYPGVACDLPTLFYSFSFAPNSNWSTFYPEGREIVEYLQVVCTDYQLHDKIQLNTDVTELTWLEDEELWEVHLAHLVPWAGDLSAKDRQQMIKDQGAGSVYLRQEIVKAKVVISGAGGLVEPNGFPNLIPGREQFEGKVFHSARWDSNVDLNGKDVVVVGTGCSAAQLVPKIVKAPYNAKSVTQLMRSPPWVMPQISPPFNEENWNFWSPILLGRIPGLARLLRTLLFLATEHDYHSFFRTTKQHAKNRKKAEKQHLAYMRKVLPEKYHKILTPSYALGCKRRIVDAGWFASFHDPRIELTSRPMTQLQPRGVILGAPHSDDADMLGKGTTQDVEIPADVVILANGFDLTTWLHPLKVRGKGGVLMQEVWDERGGPQSYMGCTMDGFPNFFLIAGPNTATGHSSIILASENMVEYSLKFIKKIISGDVRTVEVKKGAEIAWTQNIQEKLNDTVYNSGGCLNWYKTANGWNSTTYPYSQMDFGFRCMFPVWHHYNLQYTTKGLMKKTLWKIVSLCLFLSFLFSAFRAMKMENGGQALVALPAILLHNCRETMKTSLRFLASCLIGLAEQIVNVLTITKGLWMPFFYLRLVKSSH